MRGACGPTADMPVARDKRLWERTMSGEPEKERGEAPPFRRRPMVLGDVLYPSGHHMH